MKFFLLLLLIISQPVSAFAESHHRGTLSSINVGFRYSSLLQNRGVIFYRDFQIDPVLAIFLFDDRLEFLGDSIGFRDFIYSDRVRLRSRFVSISDKPLFPAHRSIRDGSPHRPSTFEWNSRIETFLGGYEKAFGEIDLGYSKDLKASHGNYLDLLVKFKLLQLRAPLTKLLVEPNAFASLGWGDSAHNNYFYGPSAAEGSFTNLSYGLWIALPEEADRFYPIVQLSRFQVLGERNREAEFSRERNQGWLFSFIATVGLLE